MASKTETGGIDYAYVGMSMSEIGSYIVKAYMGGRKRGRMGKSMMIWGAPGEGKTETVHAAVRELSRRLKTECLLVEVPTSTLEPCDVGGVPFPKEIGGVNRHFEYLAAPWAWEISVEYEEHMQAIDPKFVAPPAILFFDDLVAAHFQTQAAFFKGVQEGKWGSLTQRDNVLLVAAGNRVEDNAGANDMPTPLANRFRHCYAHPTVADWLKWGKGFREAGEPGVVGESRIHPLVLAYIRTKNDELREFNSDVATRGEKAFASPRTWEDVSELLWEGEVLPSDKKGYFTKAIMGIIGKGSASHFLGFMKDSTSLVPPAEIVRNPDTARVPSRQNLDALHATVSSLELHIKQNPKDWKAGLIYAMREEMVSDVGILLAGTMLEVINEDLPAKARATAQGDDLLLALYERYTDLIDMVITSS